MEREFSLLPDQASTTAEQVDALYFTLLGIATFFTLLICLLIVYFMIHYGRGNPVNRRIKYSGRAQNILEIAWCIVPLVIILGTFAWGAKLYIDQRRPPQDALEVYVVGKQWMWKIQHEEGRREINELHVPVGQPVALKMISEDVIHSFYIPAFRAKMDVLPGRYTHLWFEPTRTGTYHLFCAEYCGTSHASMIGSVVVQTPDEYAEWVSADTGLTAEEAGRRLLETYGCNDCHAPEAGGKAPSFYGVYGHRVPLAGGGTVVADEEYLRESILNPDAKVVAGYSKIMPTYQDQIAEEDILLIIAYLKSLSETTAAAERTP